ncbi:MAG TPA: flippase activity-associated protein Agl23 [Dehalococcoidia bacterium]|nr:flippase activity-associated protein Agl23 [Dehalococcoidia bacterium]
MRHETAYAPATPTALERALSLRLPLTPEVAAWAAVLSVAMGLRLWDLGSRALHHDETLHAFFSYLLYRDGSYEHLPMMHGPLKFFLTALSYLVFGASDYTARLPTALAGSGLALLPLSLRHRLGPAGALAAGVLIALSPVLVYFSRFNRDDMLIAFLTLALVACMWRYLDSGGPAYLTLSSLLLGLGFATMETTYIHLAIFLLFLDLWLAQHFWQQVATARRPSGPGSLLALALLVAGSWAVVALWPFTRGLRERWGIREWHRAADLMLVLGTLSAPQFAAAVQMPLAALGLGEDLMSRVVWDRFLWFRGVLLEYVIATVTVAVLLVATAAVGLAWDRRRWLLAAAAFYLPYVLLYTTFFTNNDGFASGIWGSLDYWIAQHEFRRGDQPDYYYLVVLPAYEYLPLLVGGLALLYYCLRGGVASWLLTAVAALSLLAFFGAKGYDPSLGHDRLAFLVPVAGLALYAAVRGDQFERFLCFWLSGALFAYSLMGEKMPWLTTHMALPLCLLAGYALGRMLPQAWSGGPGRALLWGAAVMSVGAGLAVYGPWGMGAKGALMGATAAIALAPSVAVRSPVATALALLAPLLMFGVKTGVTAAFQNGDVPRELLVYTQTSPAVPDVAQRIARLAEESGLGRDLPLAVDTTYAWPWQWYLRDYRQLRFVTPGPGFQPPAGSVVVLAYENAGYMQPYLDTYGPPYRYPLRWWFPEVYREIARPRLGDAIWDFLRSLGRPRTWEVWGRYLRDRVPPAPVNRNDGVWVRCPWCGSVDEVVFFPAGAQ